MSKMIIEKHLDGTIEVANGTDPSALGASFGWSEGAVADISDTEQVSGVTENDFSSAVTYTITAEDCEDSAIVEKFMTQTVIDFRDSHWPKNESA